MMDAAAVTYLLIMSFARARANSELEREASSCAPCLVPAGGELCCFARSQSPKLPPGKVSSLYHTTLRTLCYCSLVFYAFIWFARGQSPKSFASLASVPDSLKEVCKEERSPSIPGGSAAVGYRTKER